MLASVSRRRRRRLLQEHEDDDDNRRRRGRCCRPANSRQVSQLAADYLERRLVDCIGRHPMRLFVILSNDYHALGASWRHLADSPAWVLVPVLKQLKQLKLMPAHNSNGFGVRVRVQ